MFFKNHRLAQSGPVGTDHKRFVPEDVEGIIMDEAITNQELSNIDLTKVTALQQKRTLAFINHFLLTNVQFLNNFVNLCEQKLMHYERKLKKVEAAVVLLEAKLSSIPECSQIASEVNTKAPDANETHPTSQIEGNCDKIPETDCNVVENPPTIPPEYMRFVKMVQVGVPLNAVKLKVSIEGLDPGVLQEFL